jgi:hypothetical protein
MKIGLACDHAGHKFKEQLKNKSVNWGFGGLSEFTYYRTYARKMEDTGNLETWADCERMCDNM